MDLESCAQTVNQTTDIYLVDAGQNATAMLKNAWKRAEKEGKLEELANLRGSDKPISETSCLILLLSLLINLIGKELLARDFKQDKDGNLWKDMMSEVKEIKEINEDNSTHPIDQLPDSFLLSAIQYAGNKMNEYYAKAKDVDKRGNGKPSDEYTMAVMFDTLVQFCDKELTVREKSKK